MEQAESELTNQTMLGCVLKPVTDRTMEPYKLSWLDSMGVTDDEYVSDCDPTKATITYQTEEGLLKRQVAERYTRVMGYHRPVTSFNPGKKSEHAERVCFTEDRATQSKYLTEG